MTNAQLHCESDVKIVVRLVPLYGDISTVCFFFRFELFIRLSMARRVHTVWLCVHELHRFQVDVHHPTIPILAVRNYFTNFAAKTYCWLGGRRNCNYTIVYGQFSLAIVVAMYEVQFLKLMRLVVIARYRACAELFDADARRLYMVLMFPHHFGAVCPTTLPLSLSARFGENQATYFPRAICVLCMFQFLSDAYRWSKTSSQKLTH